jgi:3-hydroxybutyryl-CoA dehydrogenase
MAEIRTVAVIGAGAVGGTIAQFAALGGYRTILEDILPASLRRAQNSIRSNLDRSVTLGAISRPAADAALARVEFAATVEDAAREADLVIEAVPDELESKIEIFTLLDKTSKPQTILACTTSSVRVTEIASVTYRAPKILGMRFSTANHMMERIELVRALETDDETVEACREFAQRIGLQVEVIEDGHMRIGRTTISNGPLPTNE